jgi:hypothetical protein
MQILYHLSKANNKSFFKRFIAHCLKPTRRNLKNSTYSAHVRHNETKSIPIKSSSCSTSSKSYWVKSFILRYTSPHYQDPKAAKDEERMYVVISLSCINSLDSLNGAVAFIPKVLAVFVTLIFLFPYMFSILSDLTHEIFDLALRLS